MAKSFPSVSLADTAPVKQHAIGGGLEGAERNTRELIRWTPAIISPDRQINPVKDMADARSRDSVQNDGYAMGAIYTHRDSIVGGQYRLNATPDFKTLGADEAWSEEFQDVVESRFNLISDSPRNWIDASGANSFTGLIRLGVSGFMMTGEILATVEWLRGMNRPCSTAIQMVAPARLCNPDMEADSRTLRRGVHRDTFGRPIGYHIRTALPGDSYDFQDWNWQYIPATKPWGREQVIHIIEQLQPDQTRGIADMVASLKEMRMTKRFQDVTLQNAVVQASYAAAVESELPREAIAAAMGSTQVPMGEFLGTYMQALQSYLKGSDNIAVDGVKIPHLFPGTKLNMMPLGTPGGVGTNFEQSLLRHIAASLGLSYEQFSRDYTKTNYSSARASMTETWKFMQSRKKMVADRFATIIYALWLEEEINAGNIPLPKGMTKADFYNPIYREAFISCEWIGASRGQIDEMKETQAAILRIKSGLSTYETEGARLGVDWRKIFRQRAREDAMIKEYGLNFDTAATKPGANQSLNSMRDGETENEDDEV